MQAVEVVAQRGAGQRPPAVVARQRHDPVAQPVQLQPLAEPEVHGGHLLDVEPGLGRPPRRCRTSTNIVGRPATRWASAGRHAGLLELVGLDHQRLEVRRRRAAAAAHSGARSPPGRRSARSRRCRAAGCGAPAASATRARPAGAPRAASRSARRRRPCCRAPRSRPTAGASRRCRARRRRRARSPTRARPLSSCSRKANVMPPPCTMLLITCVAMISRRSRCSRICSREALRQRRREVAVELGRQVGVLGHVGVEQLGVQVDLAVGEQHRQLGAGQPARPRGCARPAPRRSAAPPARGRACASARARRGSARARRPCRAPAPPPARASRSARSCPSAPARRPSRVISTSSSSRCLRVRSPSATTWSSRILMFTSRSEQSTPPELSIASVLMRPPAERVLDRARAG